MFIFRHGGRCAAPILNRNVTRTYATTATRTRIEIPKPLVPTPVPIIEGCPSPTCQCREMPSDLDIEREQNINGSMAAYAEQVLICTGHTDWKSRIEDDEESVLVRQLKSFLGRHGKYSDPYHNVMITNSSFAPTESPANQKGSPTRPTSTNRSTPTAKSGNDASQTTQADPPASAFLLPSFQYVPTIPTDASSVEAFIKAFILPSQLHQSYDRLTRKETNILKRQPEMQHQFVGARKVDEILVLICGHGGRDVRCGTLGPILKEEFEEKLQRQNIPLLRDAPVAEPVIVEPEVEGYTTTARVGLISHIGGHKWAGNVIIYIPPSYTSNALAGRGIWYGRVEPGHVEGIVARTIMEGKVIKELFRGGIDQDREILRL